MTRFQTLLCVTILLATVTFFNGASAHIKIKPALPQIGDPTTVSEVEFYTAKVVSTFVAELEKECPKTEKFKLFFEKVNAYSKYVCSVSTVKGNESDMKAKAGSLFQAISDLDSGKNGSKGGKVNKSLKKEKTVAMDTVKMLQSIGEKISGGKNNKTEMNGTKKLTVEQQKEIKDGMLKWLQVITRVAKTTEETTTLQYSSKTHTKKESKEEKSSKSSKSSTSSTQTQTKTSSRAAKAGKNDDGSKSDKKSKKESDNDKKKKGESKKDAKSKKEDGKGSGSDEGKSSKGKGESNEKADKKNQQVSYGKIEPKKVEPPRNKTEERLRAEEADELD